MPDIAHAISVTAPWVGLSFIALVFLANALGVVDQSVAVSELAAAGVSQPVARVMVTLGRLVQLVATPCLFWHVTRPFAALLLATFLIGATCAAHGFWKASPADRGRQLVNFLKNTAIVGGLLLTAGWSA